MKKLLFLGAAKFQIPPIEYALSKGYFVITCDNKPDNPGHRLAHKTFDVSTIEKFEILRIAKQEKIDGILTFGSDISAPTVAFVAEQMGLPGNSYNTVLTLTNKSSFRNFLHFNGLQLLNYRTFKASEKKEVFDYIRTMKCPIILKPVDSAGSKGVSLVIGLDDLNTLVDYAFSESFSEEIIAETYIKKLGKQVCGDGFMEDGKLVFIEFGDGYFYDDGKLWAPFAETFPSAHKNMNLNKIKKLLEKILIKAKLLRGPFNFDVLITQNEEPFVIEIGPRNGGNYIPTAIFLKTNVDLIEATVESCLDWNYKIDLNKERSKKFYSCYMLHSLVSGVLEKIKFDKNLKKYTVQFNPYVTYGETVKPFCKASDAIGNLVLRFDSMEEMLEIIAKFDSYYSLVLKKELTQNIEFCAANVKE
ncbi:MAG: ATP-grasp domain-containing protein [Candidatus Melainabacteria bacterium]|nr:ATP-grasp domain-containing protein [Candidatus Melainabacteria bacterium]